MLVRTLLRRRRGAALLLLAMSTLACSGELDDAPLDAVTPRAADDPSLETDLVLKGITSPITVGRPGGVLCPDCAKLVAWTSSSIDVEVWIDAPHGFEALSIGLTQRNIRPARMELDPEKAIAARYRLVSSAEIRPIPQLVVIAYDADGEQSGLEIQIEPETTESPSPGVE